MKAGDVGNWQCEKDSSGKIYQCEDGNWERDGYCDDFDDALDNECKSPYVSDNSVWDICEHTT